MKVTYHAWSFNKLNKSLKSHNIVLVHTNKFPVKNEIITNIKMRYWLKINDKYVTQNANNMTRQGKQRQNQKTRVSESKYKQLENQRLKHIIDLIGHELNPIPKLLKNVIGRNEM